MNEELKRFLTDLITIYQEKYQDSLVANDNEDEEDKSFRLGYNVAYYDALDILESQIKVFGLNVNDLNQITPDLVQHDNSNTFIQNRTK